MYNTTLSRMQSLSFPSLLYFGGIFRLLLVFYGSYHDSVHALKYTDVDYTVFHDAAHYILHPSSPASGPLARFLSSSFHLELGTPYDRATYRYTPLLAILLLPNVFLHHLYGKILFVVADILVAALLWHILKVQQKMTARQAKLYICTAWLFNPFVANISTRGNAESILGVLTLAMLAFANAMHWKSAAICFGMAVHFKIYPIIYVSSVLATLARVGGGWASWKQIQFALLSFSSFMLLNLIMYSL